MLLNARIESVYMKSIDMNVASVVFNDIDALVMKERGAPIMDETNETWKGVIKYGFHFSPRKNRESIEKNGFGGEVYCYTTACSYGMLHRNDLAYIHDEKEWDLWVIDLSEAELVQDIRLFMFSVLTTNGDCVPCAVIASSGTKVVGYVETDWVSTPVI